MNFQKTEEQQLLLESLEEFLARCGYGETYLKQCYDEHRLCKEFFKDFLEAGFGLLGIPEEYGGTPVDMQTLVMVAEKLAEHGYPNDIISNVLQVDDIMAFGTEEQQKIVFDHLLTEGTGCFSLCITEPQAGSDNSAMTSSARHEDGKVILNGHKCFITNGKDDPYMLIVVREEGEGPDSMSMYLLPTSTPGVKIETMDKIGNKTNSMCDIYLDNVVIPESALVGVKGKGFLQVMKNFETERLVISATCLGLAQGAFNDAAAYANQRIQFGKPIGTFQLIQEKITRMYTKILNMRNMLYYTAWQMDNNISIRTTSSLVKLFNSQSACEVIDDALQIMGGIVYTEEHRISRFWRDARMYRIAGGTDEIMIHVTSRQILKEYQKTR